MLQKPPKIKFKDLEAAVNSTIKYNLLPMQGPRRLSCASPNSSIMTNITLQFDSSELQFQDKEGVSKAVVNIYARITSMSRRPVNMFEDVVSLSKSPRSMLQETSKGRQRLSEVGSAASRHVPPERGRQGHRRRQHEQLRDGAERSPLSTKRSWRRARVVLADLIEKVPTTQHRHRPVRDRQHPRSARA